MKIKYEFGDWVAVFFYFVLWFIVWFLILTAIGGFISGLLNIDLKHYIGILTIVPAILFSKRSVERRIVKRNLIPQPPQTNS